MEFAVHSPSQTPLALKFMSVSNKEHRSQVIRELQSFWALGHENIVTFYGADAQSHCADRE